LVVAGKVATYLSKETLNLEASILDLQLRRRGKATEAFCERV